jgi:hypothetical protein
MIDIIIAHMPNSAKHLTRSSTVRSAGSHGVSRMAKNASAASANAGAAVAAAAREDRSQSMAEAAVRDPSGERMLIELSQAQVDRVVRAAADSGSMAVLLSGLERVRGTLAAGPAQLQDPRLSRSLLSGLLLVASLPEDGSYMGNAQLARTLGMNVSTVHRYLQTLVAVGLVERDPSTRRYRLVQ